MNNKFKLSGPGVLVAAAFIGPGTVTVCTITGVAYGFTLLWAMVLSIIATIVLQEMAARIGLVSGKGLAGVIRDSLSNKITQTFAVILMLSAIAIGNAAYEAGNISGGVLGIEALGFSSSLSVGTLDINSWSLVLGILASIILFVGNYKVLERILVTLVIIMSIAFVTTAFVTKPDILAVLKGSFIPSFPDGSLLTIVALVGTTVVPYNLFLHASLVSEKWRNASDLPAARRDTIVAVILGGLVSMAIIICAAAIQGSEIKNAADLAQSLEPLFGDYARYFIGLGLGAAGLTSAITAPLAAAYVVQGCLGWKRDLKSAKFRAVWLTILILGIVFSSIGYSPVEIIQFAQVANGVLLPIIAGYLIWIVNKRDVLGNYVNSSLQNGISIVIWLVVFVLGARTILKVFGLL
ncbi:NRAMP (natural resistance-associated macrophage protein)-like metal ion transporter [Dokdonia sp. Hel_I_63]|uniref:Nramp family divalent metal transporter n=1 Tax=unclassified Dokdonia TaxID=2615033 RepID=UPI00020A626C|nr:MULTISPECIES: Nramp family divalent metal transporter [unclassified Dokdonia]AEE18328.1 natural resistance-associated macrophage protein [Dokdonia sp. 4H-3-7-5]TVZ22439.1 NRAMP (natural resistance-associated macrophage protein)-like metal ion transporter [Dokdonia sp. Hel_I_63]